MIGIKNNYVNYNSRNIIDWIRNTTVNVDNSFLLQEKVQNLNKFSYHQDFLPWPSDLLSSALPLDCTPVPYP